MIGVLLWLLIPRIGWGRVTLCDGDQEIEGRFLGVQWLGVVVELAIGEAA